MLCKGIGKLIGLSNCTAGHLSLCGYICELQSVTRIFKLNDVWVFPGWPVATSWAQYATNYIHNNSTLCLWQSHIGSHYENIKTMRALPDMPWQGHKYDRAILAPGFVGNFWHGLIPLNFFCKFASDNTTVFVIELRDRIPEYFYDFMQALGVESHRIIDINSQQSIFAKELIAIETTFPDWSCLHERIAFHNSSTRDTILVYCRFWKDKSRNIPKPIIDKLLAFLKYEFPYLKIVTYGNDVTKMSLQYMRPLFARAIAVIGQHGAGLANCLLAPVETVVFEYTISDLGIRP